MAGKQTVYVPFGTGTFHLETAGERFRDSAALLRNIDPAAAVPKDILFSPAAVEEYLEGKDPSILILQNVTFANGAYTEAVLRRFPDTPVVLWALREKGGDGGRLKLNSLTGAFSAGHTLAGFGAKAPFFVLGNPDEEKVCRKLTDLVEAARLVQELKGLTVASVGHTPEGFGFGRALDGELLKNFGSRLVTVEARELMKLAKECPEEERERILGEERKVLAGLDAVPEENAKAYAALLWAYRRFAAEKGVEVLASRCWPDFFVDYGTPVCCVLSRLNDEGIVSSCEGDLYGAMSMYLLSRLTKACAFFGDPVAVDEEENALIFWHCGMAPATLAGAEGAKLGVHPNRKIGPTMEFGTRGSEGGTILRIGRAPGGNLRFFVTEGRVLERPRQFLGTSLVFGTDAKAGELVESMVRAGLEPHYAVGFCRVADRIEILGQMLGIETWRV